MRPSEIFLVLALVSGAAHAWHARPLATPRLAVPRMALSVAEGPSEVYGSTAPALSLAAPCKINLVLRIIGKREDGFHELASLFQTVSLSDTLDFWAEPADDAKPLCSMEVSTNSLGREGIPTDESNLVMRALQLYADKTGERRRIHCRLHKAVPAQAGLGGGSGDCAAALFAANQLAGYRASQQQLIEWSAELGSDISFFFSSGSAYCTGRGEIIEPLPPLPPTSLYLVKPPYGCSTPAVFKELGLSPGEKLGGPNPRAMLERFQDDLLKGAPYLNDLEEPAFAVAPQLRELRDALRGYGFRHVMMSGSGSTIFCIGTPDAVSASTWQDEVRAQYECDIFEAAFCGRSDDEECWYAPD
jgi:4-diphosphocytidyl-2-C-methyl-D-erythritol kinase